MKEFLSLANETEAEIWVRMGLIARVEDWFHVSYTTNADNPFSIRSRTTNECFYMQDYVGKSKTKFEYKDKLIGISLLECERRFIRARRMITNRFNNFTNEEILLYLQATTLENQSIKFSVDEEGDLEIHNLDDDFIITKHCLFSIDNNIDREKQIWLPKKETLNRDSTLAYLVLNGRALIKE